MMRNFLKEIWSGVFILFIVSLFIATESFAGVYRFSGGPSGGTYQYYASGISTLAKKSGINVLASSSRGSVENIRLTHSGKANFSVAYSGDIFQGRNGTLKQDTRKYDNILALAYLYGAPAQLIVKADSNIKSTCDLEGRRIGVGTPGSGAAASCETYFTAMGLWDKIERNFLGYREAADAFKNNQLDGFWVLAGFPNASVLEAALQTDINLINTYKDGESVGLFEKYPCFSKVIVPANVYKGVVADVVTFQDSTIWIANKMVPEEVVYNLMKTVFAKEGLAYMISIHKSAKEMTIAGGVKGIVTPLHPGAEKFWKENGVVK
ncbi:MAG: TAXI family TRAP transporter solute-binding subunit [Desulfobacterales bacterium]|nr:TAXI family TRAP transporter solute-binding subunit [Desulfobacterales bacterium]MDD4072389.1 TAXI family TRAP transporter solute-binding subunit [Desulfobacterales bacterium]MDD4392350.1 TAXI family TRAP transporter solute-binding subunit [Desulfobacterales bacterium]